MYHQIKGGMNTCVFSKLLVGVKYVSVLKVYIKGEDGMTIVVAM